VLVYINRLIIASTFRLGWCYNSKYGLLFICIKTRYTKILQTISIAQNILFRYLEYLLLSLSMTTFKVSVPEDKTSFFLEVLELIGATYESKENEFELTEEQKQFLLSQNKLTVEKCPATNLRFEEIKKKNCP